jgi:beta-lactamase regulating signal transducer with metallopeptidase domain
MPPAELAAALAHEHAHVRRRDPLAVALLRVAGLFVPSPCARRAERDFRAAAEEAADAAAAYAVGDGRVVASALVRLTRISLRAPALAAADRGVERRVEALLANPAGEAGSSGVVLLAQALFVLTVAAPLAGVGETHHVVGFHAAVERVVEAVMHGFPVAEPTHRHG